MQKSKTCSLCVQGHDMCPGLFVCLFSEGNVSFGIIRLENLMFHYVIPWNISFLIIYNFTEKKCTSVLNASRIKHIFLCFNWCRQFIYFYHQNPGTLLTAQIMIIFTCFCPHNIPEGCTHKLLCSNDLAE